MDSIHHPPMPDSFIHAINLTTADSKITAVSIYTDRAEVTRSFRIQLKTGQNHVKISRLPNVLLDDSVRLEGRGPAAIHDVAVAFDPVPPKLDTSPVMDDLTSRKEHTAKEFERCKTTRDAIGTYLATLNVEHVAVDQLDKIFQGCDASAAKLDDKALNLQKQLKVIDDEIKEERQKEQAKKSGKLRKTITLSLFSEKESEAEFVLIYAVTGANWTAQYDVRVDLQTKETPVTLIYKAAVTQNTAEDWEDVPLKLETATPTYQVGLPWLSPWTLSFQSPVPVQYSVLQQQAMVPQSRARFKTTARKSTGSAIASAYADESEECDAATVPIYFTPAIVTSRGNVSATFDVPGTITIPSDGAAHNVTITELNLEAAMSWIAVPKCDARTRLSAKIKNASEYTLLSGAGSVYVDGSFISKSTIPAVSPGESFDCALGLDPAIRIVYHPLSKKSAKSGFYTKTSVTTYTQRITIHNTKSRTVADLRIVDQIPVSADEKIVVKLFNPPLPSVQANVGGSIKAGEKSVNNSGVKVRVAQGVLAQWGDGTEDATAVDEGTTAVGKDGKLSWICEVPSQGKMNVMLQWEVSAPAQAHVVDT